MRWDETYLYHPGWNWLLQSKQDTILQCKRYYIKLERASVSSPVTTDNFYQSCMATAPTTANSPLETALAESELVASPSQENKAAMAELFGDVFLTQEIATSLWPRQQKKIWCFSPTGWLSNTFLCLGPLSLVREDCVFHGDGCQWADCSEGQVCCTADRQNDAYHLR